MTAGDPAGLAAAMPFAAALGLDIVSADPDEVRARASWAPDRCTAGGVLHGGYLMAVADSVGAVCGYLNLPDGASTATTESSTHFLRPVPSGDVTVVATPVHVGRTVIVVQTDCTREDGVLVARTIQTQAVLTTP
jgi:1,4-dihydroxy-2-naphthoyl-CoA hydrolase